MRSRRLTRAARLLAALALAGCAGPSRPPPPVALSILGPRVVPTATVGLALRVWLVQDDPDVLAATLGPFDGARPASDTVLDPRWRDNGLRVIAVPVEHIDRIEAAFRHAGPREVRSVGLGPRWTALFEGIERDSVARIDLDSGALNLEPGALRLIARAWPETAIRDDALGRPGLASRLRVEIIPQHVAVRPRRPDPQLTVQALTPIPSQGMLLSRMTARVLADGAHAYIIVAEHPATDWTPDPHDEPPPDPTADSPADQPQEPSIFGPAPPASITLGQSMLTADPYARQSPRIIIVLIPQTAR